MLVFSEFLWHIFGIFFYFILLFVHRLFTSVTMVDPNPVFNLAELNTPDIIKNLPEFHGDTKDVHNFVNTVGPVAALLARAPEQQQRFWLSAIRNKIKGAASDRLRLYGEPATWREIKDCLLLHFVDHRDQRTLYQQLNTIRQTGTVSRFFDECLSLVTTLNDRATHEIVDVALRRATIDRNLAEGLQCFMHGVREPLKTILLSRNPTTLHDAFAISMRLQSDQSFSNQQPMGQYGPNQPRNYSSNSRFGTNNFSQPRAHFSQSRGSSNFHEQRNYNSNNRIGNQSGQSRYNSNYNNNPNYQPHPANAVNSNQAGNSRQAPPQPMEVDATAQTRRTNNTTNRGRGNHEIFENEDFQQQASEVQSG